MRKWIAAAAAALALAGCMKMTKEQPKDLPAYVAVYPGATPMMTMNLGSLDAYVVQAPASPDDVIAYYRNSAPTQGLSENTPSTTTNSADQKQASFVGEGGAELLVVVAKPQGSGSIVSLTYKPVKAAS
jgi:hypothetical protein